jgi:uncharacterized protein
MPLPVPITDFVGREAELRALERRYSSSRSGFIPVYGRRRIGKTELLLRFCSGKPTVYFIAGDRLATPQLDDFMRAAAEWLRAPHLAEPVSGGWERALQLVVTAAPSDRKLVLVLDEFQWLCQASPELPSVIQRLWDLDWQRGNRVMLVLCGSIIGFMEREVLGARSPLHGRRTADLRMEPFGYQAAAAFHPDWSVEEQARAYFVCGGIPAYLRRLEPGRSVVQNLAQELFEIDGYFQREPDYLLREELTEVRQAASILEAIGRGRSAQGEIARSVGLSPSALSPHLKQLVSLGYLERVTPLSDKRPPRTAVVYRISDPFLRFWFRFMEPSRSAQRLYTGERAFEQLVAPQWEAFCGDGFERLCREALPWFYKSEGLTGRFEVGEYWDPGVQIDVVGLRADGWADLGECRWPHKASASDAARELAARATRFPAGERTLRRLLFLRRKPQVSSGVHTQDLADLYALH